MATIIYPSPPEQARRSPTTTKPPASTPSRPADPRTSVVDSIFDDPSVFFPSPGGGGNAGLSEALQGVDIQRRQTLFEQETGLRDIAQAREEGIRAAINNALQRGIYRSGILTENVGRVERESGEAESDLRQRIAFALEALSNRAAQLKAGRGSAGGGQLVDPLTLLARLFGATDELGLQAPLPPTLSAPAAPPNLAAPAPPHLDPRRRNTPI